MIKYLNTDSRLQFWKIWKQSDNSIVIQEGKVGELSTTRRIPFNASVDASDFMWKEVATKADFNFVPTKQIVEVKIRLKNEDEIMQIEEQLKLHEAIGYFLEDTGNGEIGDGYLEGGRYRIPISVIDKNMALLGIEKLLKEIGITPSVS